MSVVRSLTERFAHLTHEVAKFGMVGAVAFVIDVGLFNLLTTPTSPLHHRVLTAKAVSMSVAATFAYFANRHWTWKHRTRSGLGREYGLFFLFNGIGLGIAEACLAISEYGLDQHTVLARNISANGFGLVLGTMFRFWAYRRWVFLAAETPEERADEAATTMVV